MLTVELFEISLKPKKVENHYTKTNKDLQNFHTILSQKRPKTFKIPTKINPALDSVFILNFPPIYKLLWMFFPEHPLDLSSVVFLCTLSARIRNNSMNFYPWMLLLEDKKSVSHGVSNNFFYSRLLELNQSFCCPWNLTLYGISKHSCLMQKCKQFSLRFHFGITATSGNLLISL